MQPGKVTRARPRQRPSGRHWAKARARHLHFGRWRRLRRLRRRGRRSRDGRARAATRGCAARTLRRTRDACSGSRPRSWCRRRRCRPRVFARPPGPRIGGQNIGGGEVRRLIRRRSRHSSRDLPTRGTQRNQLFTSLRDTPSTRARGISDRYIPSGCAGFSHTESGTQAKALFSLAFMHFTESCSPRGQPLRTPRHNAGLKGACESGGLECAARQRKQPQQFGFHLAAAAPRGRPHRSPAAHSAVARWRSRCARTAPGSRTCPT